jgi:hypothetical protein
MLAETQTRFRRSLDAADASAVLPLLAGVPDAVQRMEIYRRHHRESLVRHLHGRFPTVDWLLGPVPMRRLTLEFIAAHAPAGPCMAEYGAEFIPFIEASPEAMRHRYLPAAAQIDWLLGQAAVAIDAPPLPIAALASQAPERLPDLVLQLQPGVRYLAAGWPIDDLVRMRLSEQLPDRYVLEAEPVRLEIRGARGAFSINRLGSGDLAFRSALARGASIGAAVDAAVEAAAQFHAGAALAALFAERLVTAIDPSGRE